MGPITTTSASGPTAASSQPHQQLAQQQPRRRWGLAAVVGAALVLAAVVAAAVLVPRSSKERRSPAANAGGLPVATTTTVRLTDLTTVTNALLVANKEAHDQVAAAALANTTASTIVKAPATPSKDGFFSTLVTDLNNGGSTINGLAGGSSLGTYTWTALAGAAGSVCTPKNGAELVEFVTSTTSCTIILLRQSSQIPYNITKTMNVTTTKILIGNPIDLPILQPVKGVHRLFDVHAGGRLDTRFLQLVRGFATRLDEGRLRYLFGNTLLLRVGASYTATGCIFLQQPQTTAMWLEDASDPLNRIRMFGGFIVVLGGNMYLTGCVMFRFLPYGLPIMNNIQIGRDILCIAGNVVLLGFFNGMANLATSSINVGNVVCTFGGTLTWVGGGVYGASLANGQFGAGQNAFVGGGVMVTVGVDQIGTFLSLVRAGFGQFSVGAGVLVHVGHIHARAWGVAAVFNAGQTHAVGGGIFHKTGGTISTLSLNFMFAGAGSQTFVGSGHLGWVGSPASRATLTTSQHGLAGVWYVGAGNMVMVGIPAASSNMVRSQFMLGGELFMGAGMATWINCRRANVQLVQAFFGQGTNVFVGTGAIGFINVRSKVRRLVNYQTPGAVSFYVAGVKVGSDFANKKDIYVDKDGIVLLNKTKRHQFQRQLQQRRRLVTLTDIPNSLLLIASSDEAYTMGGGGAGSLTGTKSAPVKAQQLFSAGQAMEGLQAWVDSFFAEADEDDVLEQTSVSVSADTDCFLCGDEAAMAVVANGQCRTSKACGATPGASTSGAGASSPAATPAQLLTQAQAASSTPLALPADITSLIAATESEDGEPMRLPDLFFLWHDLVAFCPTIAGEGEEACVTEAQLKEAIKQQLAPFEGVAVTVASTTLPAAVHEIVTPDVMAAQREVGSAAGCADGFKFKAYITTYDDALQAPLEEAWRAVVQNPGALLATVQRVTAAESGAVAATTAGVCGLTVKKVMSIAYPPVERMPAFQPKGLSFVGPSILIGSPASIAPVDHLVRGETYTLFVENFPAKTTVDVRLLQGPNDKVGTAVTQVAAFEDDGLTELSWTVPMDVGEGRYYLKAATSPGGMVYATSQAFAVVAEPLKRWRRY